MGKKLLGIFVLGAATVTAAGIFMILSLPETSAQAEALQATAMPTVMSTTAVPTVAATPAASAQPTATPTPAPATGSFGTFQYVVQPGDTLGDIAVRYNLTLAQLAAANPQITNINLIFPGQVVNVPNGGSIPTTGGTATPTTVPNNGNGVFYVVQSGDTLGAIALKFNVTVQAILAANPAITNANLILPGQVIFIPNGGGPGIPPTGGGSTYVVQSGDTLSAIAVKFSTTVNAILAANPQITDRNLIIPGQVIQLPTGGSIPTTGGNTYVVQSGDTMGSIAAQFGVTLQALVNANPQVTNVNLILPGQVLTIPSAGTIPTTGGNTYTVVVGDTLFSIAQAHNTSVQAILGKNPGITNPNLIFPGQVITLP